MPIHSWAQWRSLKERKVRKEGRKFSRVCTINYKNKAKSDDYLRRKIALKMSYLAISAPFSVRPFADRTSCARVRAD